MNRKRKTVARKSTKKPDNQDLQEWDGYMDLKKQKLMVQYEHDKGLCSEKLSDIFKHVAILVNGLTRPSAEELKVLMTRHGGVYHTYQMSTTTHILASNLAHAKVKHIGSVPIVKPQWITESIDMQKLLDYRRYLLFTNQSTTQPRLQFPVIPKRNANVASSSKETPQSMSEQTTGIETKVNSLPTEELKLSKASSSFSNIPSVLRNDIECSEIQDNSPNIIEYGVDACGLLNKEKLNGTDIETSSNQSENQHGEDSKRSSYSYESDEDIFADNSPDEKYQATSKRNLEPSETCHNKEIHNIVPSYEMPSYQAKVKEHNNVKSTKLQVNPKIVDEFVVSKETIGDGWNSLPDDIFADVPPPQEQSQVNYTKNPPFPELNETGSSLEKKHVATSAVPSTSEAKVSPNIDTKLPMCVTKGIHESSTNKQTVVQQTNNVAKTAADPTFLKEFYNNSRLHLISTLCAEFKQLVVEMRENSDGKFPGKDALIQKKLCGELPAEEGAAAEAGPVIMHIDMDCFFVSVGLRARPQLRGRPVAVTHGRPGRAPGGARAPDALAELELRAEHSDQLAARSFDLARDAGASMSEVASCSYEARRRGVRNGMFLGTALRLCPDLQTMPYDFQGYREVSTTLYRTIASYTLDIEAVSCDEMYVDCTGLLRDTGLSVHMLASHLRAEIQGLTGCPCSAGSGPSRLLARLATRRAKPAGQYHVTAGEAEAFVRTVPLSEVPGVGPAALTKLRGLGLTTCGDVQHCPRAELVRVLGRGLAERLRLLTKGVDDRPLDFDHRRKTVSAEVNYGIRFNEPEEAYAFLKSLSQEVFNRADVIGMRAKCVTLKLLVRAADAPVQTAKYLGHGICDTLTKSATLNTVLPSSESIYREIKLIYDRLNAPFQDLRGIGIHLTKLEKNKGKTNTLMSFCKAKSATTEVKPQIQASANGKHQEQFSDRIDVKNHALRGRLEGREPSPVAGPSNLPTGSKTDRGEISAVDKNKTTLRSSSSISYAGSIDYEVLKALPEEIRREVIKEYKIEEVVEEQMRMEYEDSRASSASITRPGSTHVVYEPPEATAPQSPFHTIPMQEVKSVFRSWTTKESEPGRVDTEMLGTFCRELAELRDIEHLKMLVSFFYRILETKDCKWHRAYFEIVNTAQQGMVARYGSTLLVNRAYECCKHC